jgi:hypothetical protein
MNAHETTTTDPAVTLAIASLVILTKDQVPNMEDSCPICLLSFKAILDSEPSGHEGQSSTSLTKIGACGHAFCVECLSEWIRGRVRAITIIDLPYITDHRFLVQPAWELSDLPPSISP